MIQFRGAEARGDGFERVLGRSEREQREAAIRVTGGAAVFTGALVMHGDDGSVHGGPGRIGNCARQAGRSGLCSRKGAEQKQGAWQGETAQGGVHMP